MGHKECDIALIFPPIREWDNPRNFPTGLGLIASRLRYAGYRVKVIDANGLRLSEEAVLEEVRECRCGLVGIGGLITTYGWVKRISARLKGERVDCPIMLGGSVGTSIVETALEHTAVDVIALGEADDTAVELSRALLNGEKLDEVAGLAYLQDGQVVRTAERGLKESIDELPYPGWDLFPM